MTTKLMGLLVVVAAAAVVAAAVAVAVVAMAAVAVAAEMVPAMATVQVAAAAVMVAAVVVVNNAQRAGRFLPAFFFVHSCFRHQLEMLRVMEVFLCGRAAMGGEALGAQAR
jgi:hypothetical protein